MDPLVLAQLLGPLSPTARADLFNSALMGFDAMVGLRFLSVDATGVQAELRVEERHTQPYGLCHGGVYAAVAESVCSVGAALSVMAEGFHAVGIENRTRFLKATRPGTRLQIHATPAAIRGVVREWDCEITGEDGVPRARATVVVRALRAGTAVAGETVGLKGGLSEEG